MRTLLPDDVDACWTHVVILVRTYLGIFYSSWVYFVETQQKTKPSIYVHIYHTYVTKKTTTV